MNDVLLAVIIFFVIAHLSWRTYRDTRHAFPLAAYYCALTALLICAAIALITAYQKHSLQTIF